MNDTLSNNSYNFMVW